MLWNLNLSVVISQNNNHSQMHDGTNLTLHKLKAGTSSILFSIWKYFILYHCQQGCHLINTHNGRFMNHCSMKKYFCGSRNAINWSFSNTLEGKQNKTKKPEVTFLRQAYICVQFSIFSISCLKYFPESLGIWSKSLALDCL